MNARSKVASRGLAMDNGFGNECYVNPANQQKHQGEEEDEPPRWELDFNRDPNYI